MAGMQAKNLANSLAKTGMSLSIETKSPFKNPTSWLMKVRNAVGFGEANIFVLRRATVYQYEACTDQLDPIKFFKHLRLDDTLLSFFLVTQLHVWMCQTRSMAEGMEGRKLRNEIVDRMWQDLDTRLSLLDVHSQSERKALLLDLLYHHQGAMLSYDEGLLTDDRTLASALWRTLYCKEDFDPRALELAVNYVRTQMDHIRSISPRAWCLGGKFKWAPFPPLT